MGHTHYWNNPVAFTDETWNAFVKDIKKLFKQSKIPLANGMGESGSTPEIQSDYIQFNGVEDDGCETCSISKHSVDFDFCKTRLRPYDSIVVEALKLARNHNPNIQLRSDGENVFD